MSRSRFVAAVGACIALSALLVGCGPPWSVVYATQPDPFVNQRSFAVLPVDFTGVRVGDKAEAEYLAEKDAETRSNWVGDKAGINEEYAKALRQTAADAGIRIDLATGPGATFLIRPVVQFIEPGFYVGVASGSSEVRMDVQITAPDGRVIDEIAIVHRTGASIVNAASGTRLRKDAENLGEYTAKYIMSRVGVGG